MRAVLLLGACFLAHAGTAQLINGSFEDDLGNFSDSGWVSTCSVGFGPAAPGFGNTGILVPHGQTPGCGWSRLYQFVPAIGDGETWTLSGWCGVFTFPFFSPYVGLRFGWQETDGTLHFNTAALTNTGSYTYLSVTNTFALAPGDTVFVECDPGTTSGMGSNQLFAMFDGLELNDVSTDVPDAAASATLNIHPDPVHDRIWVASPDPIEEVRVVDLGTGSVRPLPHILRGGTAEVDVTGLVPGAYMLWVRSAHEVRTGRFVKL